MPSTPSDLTLESVTYDTTDDRSILWRFVEQARAAGTHMSDMVPILSSQEDCHDLIVARAVERIGEETQELIAGVCTIALEGEWRSMQPTVVGVTTDGRLRGRGIGKELLRRGIARTRELIAEHRARIARLREEFSGLGEAGERATALLAEQELKTDRILIEAVTQGGHALAASVLFEPVEEGREGVLQPEYRDIDYRNHSSLSLPPV